MGLSCFQIEVTSSSSRDMQPDSAHSPGEDKTAPIIPASPPEGALLAPLIPRGCGNRRHFMAPRVCHAMPLEPDAPSLYIRRMASNSSGWTQVKVLLLVGLAILRATVCGTLGAPLEGGVESRAPKPLPLTPHELSPHKSH